MASLVYLLRVTFVEKRPVIKKNEVTHKIP